MCERLALSCDADELRRVFRLQETLEHTSRHNIAAGRSVPVFVSRGEGLVPRTASWGLVFSWVDAPTVFKNKALRLPYPTALHSPYYRRLTQSRRCAVPVTGFYLWHERQEGVQPIFIKREDGAPFGVAGIYDIWRRSGQESLSFSLVTHDARPPCDTYADAQPALLEPDDVAAWLCNEPKETEAFSFEPKLRAYPISDKIFDERRDGPELTEPL